MASGSDGSGRKKRLANHRLNRTPASQRKPQRRQPVPNANGDGGFDGAPF